MTLESLSWHCRRECQRLEETKHIENQNGHCHFSPIQTWEGPLYHKHKATQGRSVTQEELCRFLGLVCDERLNENPKRKGRVVSTDGKCVLWGGEEGEEGNYASRAGGL